MSIKEKVCREHILQRTHFIRSRSGHCRDQSHERSVRARASEEKKGERSKQKCARVTVPEREEDNRGDVSDWIFLATFRIGFSSNPVQSNKIRSEMPRPDLFSGLKPRRVQTRRVFASVRSICVVSGTGGNNFCRLTAPVPTSPQYAQRPPK